jgi:hypothetical protein
MAQQSRFKKIITLNSFPTSSFSSFSFLEIRSVANEAIDFRSLFEEPRIFK